MPHSRLTSANGACNHVAQVRRWVERYELEGPRGLISKLRERLGIDLAFETVRTLMTAGGLWLPRRLRPPKARQPCLPIRSRRTVSRMAFILSATRAMISLLGAMLTRM